MREGFLEKVAVVLEKDFLTALMREVEGL